MISSSSHVDMFYSAADWLVRHQDINGGWPIVRLALIVSIICNSLSRLPRVSKEKWLQAEPI